MSMIFSDSDDFEAEKCACKCCNNERELHYLKYLLEKKDKEIEELNRIIKDQKKEIMIFESIVLNFRKKIDGNNYDKQL